MTYLDPQNPALANQPEKNLLLNGDFSILQGEQTSVAALGGELHDRWLIAETADAGVNRTPQFDVAIAAGIVANSQRITVSLADTGITGSEYFILGQPIEANRVQQLQFGQAGAKSITLSFWHKHTVTGTQCVAIQNGAKTRTYVAEYTQSVSNTWEFATITIPGDVAGTWLYNEGQIGLILYFALAVGGGFDITAGSWQNANAYGTSNQVNNLASVSNEFEIARVQLEVGAVATEFENRDVGTSLMQCMRFVQFFEGFQGVADSATTMDCSIQMPVRMVEDPFTILVRQNGTFDELTMSDGVSTFTQSVGVSTPGAIQPGGFEIQLGNFSGLTAGDKYIHVPDGVRIYAAVNLANWGIT